MRSSILSECRDTEGYVQLWGFQLLRKQGNFAVTGEEKFVFTISLSKEIYMKSNLECTRKEAITDAVLEVDSVPDVRKVVDIIVASIL